MNSLAPAHDIAGAFFILDAPLSAPEQHGDGRAVRTQSGAISRGQLEADIALCSVHRGRVTSGRPLSGLGNLDRNGGDFLPSACR